MIRSLLIIVCVFMALPLFSQNYVSGWKYQLALHQETDGSIIITYSKMYPPSQAQTSSSSALTYPPNEGQENTDSRNYQYTLNYFNNLGQNIPPVITLPTTTFKRMPDPTNNEAYPMPDW